MKKIAIFLIEVYQKYISPYKGFSCAYRVATGEVSCSGYGKKVISRYGMKKGYALLQRRFNCCKHCSDELKKEMVQKHAKQHINHKMALQGGFCDIPDCGGCDLPGCDIPNCNLPDCGSVDFPGCEPKLRTPSCGGFTVADFCDIGDCCGDCGGSSSSKNVNNEKNLNKVQKKMERKEEEDKKVSLEKEEDIEDSDD